MVFRFSIDGFWFGEFPDRQSIHDHLVKKGWVQVIPTSNVYYLRVKGILTGTGEVIQTPKVLNISKLPNL